METRNGGRAAGDEGVGDSMPVGMVQSRSPTGAQGQERSPCRGREVRGWGTCGGGPPRMGRFGTGDSGANVGPQDRLCRCHCSLQTSVGVSRTRPRRWGLLRPIHACRKLLLRARRSNRKVFALVSSLILKKHPEVTLRSPRSGKVLPSFRDAVVCISALSGYARHSLAASKAPLGTC